MQRVVPALIAATLIVLTTTRAEATPTDDLSRARAELERGEYARSAALLEPLLYPPGNAPPLLGSTEELKESRYLLGVSYFFLKRLAESSNEFAALLYLDPEYKLDPVIELPSVYAHFESVRKRLERDLDELRKKKAAEAERRRTEGVVVERTVTYRNPAWNFVPLGAPQAQLGRKGWSRFFLVTQAVFGGASIALFTYQGMKYGFLSPEAPPADEVEDVRTIQTFQIASGALFFGFYAWQVVDAYANDAPKVQTKRSFEVGPGPGGTTGLGLSWEY